MLSSNINENNQAVDVENESGNFCNSQYHSRPISTTPTLNQQGMDITSDAGVLYTEDFEPISTTDISITENIGTVENEVHKSYIPESIINSTNEPNLALSSYNHAKPSRSDDASSVFLSTNSHLSSSNESITDSSTDSDTSELVTHKYRKSRTISAFNIF